MRPFTASNERTPRGPCTTGCGSMRSSRVRYSGVAPWDDTVKYSQPSGVMVYPCGARSIAPVTLRRSLPSRRITTSSALVAVKDMGSVGKRM